MFCLCFAVYLLCLFQHFKDSMQLHKHSYKCIVCNSWWSFQALVSFPLSSSIWVCCKVCCLIWLESVHFNTQCYWLNFFMHRLIYSAYLWVCHINLVTFLFLLAFLGFFHWGFCYILLVMLYHFSYLPSLSFHWSVFAHFCLYAFPSFGFFSYVSSSFLAH